TSSPHALSLHDALPISVDRNQRLWRPGLRGVETEGGVAVQPRIRLAALPAAAADRGHLRPVQFSVLPGAGAGELRHDDGDVQLRSEEHTSELQSPYDLV